MKDMYSRFTLILLFVLILLFAGVFTYLNVFYYGSVLKITLPFYSFALILPLYSAYKNKRVKKQAIIFLYSIYIIIVMVFIVKLPEYTYEDAVMNLENKYASKSEKLLKKYTEKESLFYMGDYLININNELYSYSLKEHIIKKVKGD